jgi:nitroreductase
MDNVMLAAYNEGVDSCWINFFNPDELAKAFNLPEDEEILMLLDIGVIDALIIIIMWIIS